VPLVILPDYPGTREYLLECFSRWHYSIQETDRLSMEGFRRSRLIHIQVLSDALPLEGVPTGVTRVANNVRLGTTCISCMYDSLTMGLCMCNNRYL
jgi:hypothetical protein